MVQLQHHPQLSASSPLLLVQRVKAPREGLVWLHRLYFVGLLDWFSRKKDKEMLGAEWKIRSCGKKGKANRLM